MAEGDADQVKQEMSSLTRVERIKAGIGRWVESQMPPAVGERYRKTFTVFAERLAANRPELLERLQGPIKTAAEFAGWADPMVKVALGAAALYGGVTLLLNPTNGLLGKAAVFYGKEAVAAGTAAAVGAYRFVETGVKELGAKIKLTVDRIWQGGKGNAFEGVQLPPGPTGPKIPSQGHPPGGFTGGGIPDAPAVPVRIDPGQLHNS